MSKIRLVLSGVLLAFSLTACNVIPQPVEVRVYALPYQQVEASSETFPVTLQVSQPRAVQSLDNARVSVLRGDGRQAYLQQIRLQDRLPVVVQQHLLRGLRDTQIVRSVVSNSDATAYQFELISQIEQFAIREGMREGQAEQAEIELTMHLVRGSNREVLASRTFNIERETSGRGAENVLNTLGTGLSGLHAEIRDWIEGALTEQSF